MADFITRLVERTLGVAPVVRPLAAPTFAPDAGLHEAAPEEGPPDDPRETAFPAEKFPGHHAAETVLDDPENPAAHNTLDPSYDPGPGEGPVDRPSDVRLPPVLGPAQATPGGPAPRRADNPLLDTATEHLDSGEGDAPPAGVPAGTYEDGQGTAGDPVERVGSDRASPEVSGSVEPADASPDRSSDARPRVRPAEGARPSLGASRHTTRRGAGASGVGPSEAPPTLGAAPAGLDGPSVVPPGSVERGGGIPPASGSAPHRSGETTAGPGPDPVPSVPPPPARRYPGTTADQGRPPGPSAQNATDERPGGPYPETLPPTPAPTDRTGYVLGTVTETVLEGDPPGKDVLPVVGAPGTTNRATTEGRPEGPGHEDRPPASASPGPAITVTEAAPGGDPSGNGVMLGSGRPGPSSSGSPEPVIRVNIGRVEVRAVTPPPALQQAAEPARLSLNDYLRSRSEGRR